VAPPRAALGDGQREEPTRGPIAGRALLARLAHVDRHDDTVVEPPGRHPAALEEAPDRAGDRGEHDVVHRAAEAAADRLHVGQVEHQPLEAPVGPDAPVQRRHRGRRQAGARHLPDRGEPLGGRHACALGFVERRPHRAHDRDRRGEAPQRLVGQELRRARRRPRPPGHGRLDGVLGDGAQQHGEDVDGGEPVSHAVVRLDDEREAPALEALDDPHLPERAVAVERLRGDAGRELLQLLGVAGAGQARVPDVVGEVEVDVVHPHRVVVERDPRQALPVARDLVQLGGDVGANAVDVDAAVGAGERPRRVDGDAAGCMCVSGVSKRRNAASRSGSRSYAGVIECPSVL
jgi:hypothetical protein